VTVREPLVDGSRGIAVPKSGGRIHLNTANALTVLARFWPLAPILAFYAWFIQRTSFTYEDRRYYTLFDDAMISMRYARNLVEGHGLVWNPGEAPVEGFTNPLWVLWMAVLHATGLSEATLPLAVSISGVATLLTSAFVFRSIARQIYPDHPLTHVAAFWGTLLYYPLIFWTLRGMETGLITLFVALGIRLSLALKERYSLTRVLMLGAVTSLGLLTRMDFLVPAVIMIGTAVLWTPGQRRTTALGSLGLLILTLAALTAWRLSYYGEFLPNTYYLKVEGVSSLVRMQRGLAGLIYVSAVHLAVPLMLALAYFAAARRRLRGEECLLAVTFGGFCAYSMQVGGDAWEGFGFTNRYLAPGVPLLLILATRALLEIASMSPKTRRNLLLGLALASLVLAALNLYADGPFDVIQVAKTAQYLNFAKLLAGLLTVATFLYFARWRYLPAAAALIFAVTLNFAPLSQWGVVNAPQSRDDMAWSAYGLLIRDTTTEDARVAVVAAGAISYFSHRTTLDELGKVDPVIAKGPQVRDRFIPGHSKWDLGRTLGTARPDLIAQLYIVSAEDIRKLDGWGYGRLTGSCYSLVGSSAVARERFLAGMKALQRTTDGLCTAHPMDYAGPEFENP
jgi:hypothetical protein